MKQEGHLSYGGDLVAVHSSSLLSQYCALATVPHHGHVRHLTTNVFQSSLHAGILHDLHITRWFLGMG
jgi:hypothetical protein